jgi:diguanylate cyclase (GGDEF)-like protein
MSQEAEKYLEKARKYLEKNKIQDAIEAYQSALTAQPGSLEATQALGDLYTHEGDSVRAATYYGMIFDRMIQPVEEPRAIALYTRFLKGLEQPPERQARFAILLHKAGRIPDAIENYSAAAERFKKRGKDDEALKCLEQVAELDPDDAEKQVALAELAEARGKNEVAARGYVRAGQLALGLRQTPKAVELLGKAHRAAPKDQEIALLHSQGLLLNGDAKAAVATLEPVMPAKPTAPFLKTFGEALLRNGEYDRAREPLAAFYKLSAGDHALLFILADKYATENQEAKAVEVLSAIRDEMKDSSAQNDFAARLDRVAEKHPSSLAILEFWASVYSGLNRESRYFDVLVHLFDAYIGANRTEDACDVLDRMVDIDAYDYRNQQRLEQLRGRADADYLSRMASRLGVTLAGGEGGAGSADAGANASEVGLDDLLVQAEIFLQYSLQPKAVERLQRIAQLYPGEEQRNERFRNLCELAKWWPAGAEWTQAEPTPAAQQHVDSGPGADAGTPQNGVYIAETLRDLTKISEIAQNIYKQANPQAMLTYAATEVGKHLRASRCIAAMGSPGQAPQITGEYCGPGISPATEEQIAAVVSQMDRAAPDPLGGLPMQAAAAPALREIGLDTGLGVVLVDKQSQAPAGMLMIGHTGNHRWKPDETYFLHAVGDQVLLGVSHTRIRSLVQTLNVADAKTGLLARGSYSDRLLNEMQRAKTHGSPLSLAILQIDRGPEMTRQQGEAFVEKYFEQVSQVVVPMIRPGDLAVKYTSWSLAVILPDTPLTAALGMADKMRQAARAKGSNGTEHLTLSAGVVEAVGRADYDAEDVVTELMNRAESSVEEAAKRGGDTVVSLNHPKV